jgi:hypothetical protein
LWKFGIVEFWYILWKFGIVEIWYILWKFGVFLPVLVYCINKKSGNPANLPAITVTSKAQMIIKGGRDFATTKKVRNGLASVTRLGEISP